MARLSRSLREISQYPSAIGGALIILFLLVVSLYTIIAIPYAEAIRLWRGGQDVWYHSPTTAQPTWVNYFRNDKLPETVIINSKDLPQDIREIEGGREISIAMPFD